jgi:two-component system, NarL family, sensor kinase
MASRKTARRAAKPPKRGAGNGPRNARRLAGLSDLIRKMQTSREWLAEAAHTLKAIREGQVDALVVQQDQAERVMALRSFEELEKTNEELAAQIYERTRSKKALRDSEMALRRSQGELRALTAQLMTAQEEERRSIARDLHDDLNQRLAAMTMGLEALLKDSPITDDLMGQSLQTFLDGAHELSEHIRGLAYRLHSSVLDDLGLPIALRRYVEEYTRRTGIACDVEVRGLPQSMPQQMANGLYLIMQECLGNIFQHAQATHASIQLSATGTHLRLSVRDNGVGCDLDSLDPEKQGLGFISMRERARLLNGTFSVQSRPGQGTVVNVRVSSPLNATAPALGISPRSL